MKAFGQLFLLTSFLLGTLIPLGGLVGGIWLAANGEWPAIGLALLSALAGAGVISIALMPALPLISRTSRHSADLSVQELSIARGITVASWAGVVITAWCTVVALAVLRQSSSALTVPYMLLAYSAAAAPIAFMSEREAKRGNEYGPIIGLFVFGGVAAGILIVDAQDPSWQSLAICVAIGTGCGYAASSIVARQEQRRKMGFYI